MRAHIQQAFEKVVFPILLAFMILDSFVIAANSSMRTVVYGKGCLSCFLEYVEKLKTALREVGITEVELRYLESDLEAVRDLEQLHIDLGVPDNMRGSVVVSLNDEFLFEGYVPAGIILDFLVNHTQEYNSIVVSRDELKGLYKVMDEKGQIKDCEIEGSISECVGKPEPTPLGSVLLLVAVSGLLDGINPCAFAVLLFFIALLFVAGTPQRTGKRVLTIGSVYIVAVYLAYLSIGLAIIKVIALTPFPHLVAKAGAILLIFLGFISIKDYFLPGRGFSLGIPRSMWETIRRWMHKFTVPATFVAGLLVGFLEFPCTGGIYVAVLGMLASESTFSEGFVYLILYNFAFVLPLIVILMFAAMTRIMRFSILKWQKKEQKIMKLFSGSVMVILGIILLFLQLV